MNKTKAKSERTVGDVVEPIITDLLYWSPLIFSWLTLMQSGDLFLVGEYTLAYWACAFAQLLMFFQVVMIIVVKRKLKEMEK